MPDNDPISILMADHEDLRALFSQLEREPNDSATIEELAIAIEQHTLLEEQIFYPAFREVAVEQDLEHMVYEAIEEHDLVDTVIAELEPDQLDLPVLKAKLKVLQELVLHHVEKEEQQLFPLARKLLGEDRLAELGEAIRALHDQQYESEELEDSEGSDRGTHATVDVNHATAEQLRDISGIDEVRAERIVAYRDSHGQFEDWEELRQIEGFDEGLVKALRDQASLGHASASRGSSE